MTAEDIGDTQQSQVHLKNSYRRATPSGGILKPDMHGYQDTDDGVPGLGASGIIDQNALENFLYKVEDRLQ